jgi:predicted ATPase
MGGEFKKDDMGHYYFDKQGKKIDLVNTATGVKYFGIFQVLSQNNYLNKNTILVLDEPEVHLHPKWQLEMAKIIVELVKNGVKIVVNSHSPYMIQALIKYARDEEIVDNSNFYLAEKDRDYANINNVNDELNKIFELLAEPMNEVYE